MAPNLNAILHGQNSTAQPVWHPNPTVRGTWNIYQTCVIGKAYTESQSCVANSSSMSPVHSRSLIHNLGLRSRF